MAEEESVYFKDVENDVGDISFKDVAVFSTVTLISILIPVVFLKMIRGFIIREAYLTLEADTSNILFLFDTLIVYYVIYKVFMLIATVLFVIVINTIFAKVLNYQVGKTLLSIVLSLSLGFILFHVINYIIFAFFDPLGFRQYDTLETLVEIFGDLDSALNSLTGLNGEVNDGFTSFDEILFEYFYFFSFVQSGSVQNYFILYFLGSGTYEGWAMFRYDYIFIILFTIPFFFIIFPRLTKKCQCIQTDEEVAKKSRKIHKRTLGEIDITDYVEEMQRKGESLKEL